MKRIRTWFIALLFVTMSLVFSGVDVGVMQVDAGTVNGWVKNGSYWYYHSNGTMVVNKEMMIDGVRYRFDHLGRMQGGWYEEVFSDGSTGKCYYDEPGHRVSGFHEIDGYIYYFSEVLDHYMYYDDRYECYDEALGEYFTYRFDKEGHMVTGWYEEVDSYGNTNKYYYDEKGHEASGFREIDGYTYYFNVHMICNQRHGIYDDEAGEYVTYRFDEEGHMVTGWYEEVDSYGDTDKYYYDEKGHEASGFREIDGYTYYFGYRDNSMVCNERYGIYDDEAGEYVTYRFDEEGHMVTGWYEEDSNGDTKKYYYDETGREASGFVELDGYVYYFDRSDGNMVCNQRLWTYYDDADNEYYTYRADKDGHIVFGWYEEVDSYGDTDKYYYDEKGHEASGFQELDGYTYYFDQYYGYMHTDYEHHDETAYYYFDKDGKLADKAELKDGWFRFRGETYYRENGDWIYDTLKVIDGNVYYFEYYKGKMSVNKIEWLYDEIAGTNCPLYFGADGAMMFGWYEAVREDGTTYTAYSDADGHMVDGLYEIDGDFYYFVERELTTDYAWADDGYIYYFGADGKFAAKKTAVEGLNEFMGNTYYYYYYGSLLYDSFEYYDGHYHYFDKKGRMVIGTDIWIGDGYYRFDEEGRAVTGWYKNVIDENTSEWYYHDSYGRAVSGTHTIGGSTYYFDLAMKEDYFLINGNYICHFGKDGKLAERKFIQKGWNKMSAGTAYNEDGVLLRGVFKTVGDYTYYFEESGRMAADTELTLYDEADGTDYTYCFDADGHMVTGWYEDGSGKRYYADENGRVLTGVQEIDGDTYYLNRHVYTDYAYADGSNLYYFGEDGRLVERAASFVVGFNAFHGSTYYYENESLVYGAFRKVDGYTYYFDPDGKMAVDTLKWITDEETGKDYQYRFDQDGRVMIGWYDLAEDDGTSKRYYSDENGHVLGGVQEIDGDTYYLNMHLYTDYVYGDKTGIYYFGEDGKLVEKAEGIKDGFIEFRGNKYYFENSALLYGTFKKTGGYTYYFAPGGEMVADMLTQIADAETGKSFYYRFDQDGRMAVGWHDVVGEDGTSRRYYADENGHILTGVQEIGGDTYYLNWHLYRNHAYADGKSLYYFGEDGKLVGMMSGLKNGFNELLGNKFYYDGSSLVYDSFKKIGDYTYFFEPDGRMAANSLKWVVDKETGTGYYCYFDADGHMAVGWYEDESGKRYYADENGHVLSGVQEIDGDTYYLNWYLHTDYVYADENYIYYFGSDGRLAAKKAVQDGFNELLGCTYYYEDGRLFRDGFTVIGKYTYYFNSDASMIMGGVHNLPDKETGAMYNYRFDRQGRLCIGWYEDTIDEEGSVGLFYSDKSGHMAFGVYEVDGDTYFFNWHVIKNIAYADKKNLYYFGEDGKLVGKTALRTGFNELLGNTYYYENGKLLYDSYKNIGDDTYYFDKNGHMVSDCLHIGGGFLSFFGKDGKLVEKTELREGFIGLLGNTYYYANGALLNGICEVGDAVYYFTPEMHTDYMLIDKGTLYYFGKDGKLAGKTAVKEGFNELLGSKYYYDGVTLLYDAFKKVGGDTYYFGSDGKMAVGTLKWIVDKETGKGYHYRFDKDGRMMIGWYDLVDADGSSRRYYADENGHVLTGVQEINGDTYYLNWYLYTDYLYLDDTNLYYFGEDGKLVGKAERKEGFIELLGNTYYCEDGKLFSDGLKVVGEYTYYFNSDGTMISNGFKTVGEYTYYFDENGHMAADTGLVLVDAEDGKEYHYRFDKDGRMMTGWFDLADEDGISKRYYADAKGHILSGVQEIDGDTYYLNRHLYTDYLYLDETTLYYFGEDGKLIGKAERKEGFIELLGNTYYCEDGKLFSDGLKVVGEYTYYFNSDGTMISNGFKTVGEYTYYFDENGHLYKEHMLIDETGIYCFDEDGKLVDKADGGDGWKKLNGEWYYVKNGALIRDDWFELGGKRYYFEADGHMLAGGTFYAGHGDERGEYCFGADGAVQTGWQQIGDNWYYMDASGIRTTGWQQIGSKWYYMTSDGAMVTGWQTIGGKQYYMGTNGMMTTGWQQIGSKWYYMTSDGVMVTGWQQIGSKWYYMTSGGEMTTGLQTIGGKQYYMGTNGVMTTGWQKVGTKWYYMNASGYAMTGWQQIGSKWYYMASDGVMTTGWQQIGSKWYYMTSGGEMTTGLQTIGGKQYYMGTNGVMTTGWQKVGATWYYMDANGCAVTGWQQIGAKWYYMNSDGAMVTGWMKQANKWYYMKNDGVMATGWQAIGGKWYYMKADGEMTTGWLKLANKWYYFEHDGVMAVGEKLIGGVSYTFDKNGVWIK